MHDEAAALAAFAQRLVPALDASGESWEIVCVNDGSRDATLDALLQWRAREPRVRVVDLTRNFGKEAALTCGIDHARGRAVIPIDADLQDPPELIVEMVRLWRSGFDVVLPQRTDRSSDGVLKRATARWFYRLHNVLADAPLPENVGDFRLMDRRVVDALGRLPERRRFMKGLFAWVGFRQALIPYAREPRRHGRSKFSGWRLWNFALDGITSFSTTPLKLATYVGLATSAFAFAYGGWVIVKTMLFGEAVKGYPSLMVVMLFLGGIQLMALGLIGEYLGRLYLEAKQRPLYLVDELVGGPGKGPTP